MISLLCHGQVIHTQHHILGRRNDRLAIGRLEQVREASINSRASLTAFCESGTCTAIWSPSKSALKAVVTKRMQLDGRAFDQNRFKGLDTETVQGRRTIQQNRAFTDHAFERFPDLRPVAFDQAACTFDVRGVIILTRGGRSRTDDKVPAPCSWADRIDTVSSCGPTTITERPE